jgi:PPK2 family polyphosphate:nucleotide phosphotransferase
MEIQTSDFLVREKETVDVTTRPTVLDPVYRSEKDYKEQLEDKLDHMSKLQTRLYASDSQALLIILQAMDTGGKDGIIRHVMSGVSAFGCRVSSFGRPSTLELNHDYLWRTTLELPPRGMIGVFNRSYYEEVLVVRVHPEVLAGQHLPKRVSDDGDIWKHRFQSIRNHERHLHRNGYKIVKLFLHISREEQRQRLLDRIEDPEKTWKFKAADIAEREYWDQYMIAYSEAISATSTDNCPWHIVPGDDKLNARLYAATIINEALEEMKPKFPELSLDDKAELERCRAELVSQAT